MDHTSIYLPLGNLIGTSSALYSVYASGVVMYLQPRPDFWTHLSLQISSEDRTVENYQAAGAYFHAIGQEFIDKAEVMALEETERQAADAERREKEGKPNAG
jgi:hypothetical protein